MTVRRGAQELPPRSAPSESADLGVSLQRRRARHRGRSINRRTEPHCEGSNLLARVPSAVKSIARPFRPVYARLRDRLGHAIYARGAKLSTGGVVMLEELGLAGPERRFYKPAGWSILPRILPTREVSVDDVFIDYGSGMGRIVYEAAARYQFKRVIGVELSSQLNEIARSNIDRNTHLLRCREVQFATADVLDYEPPPDVTVAFFNNPFKGKILETALTRLLDAADGPLRIIYVNPIEHDLLMTSGRLKVVRRLRGWRPGTEWSRSNSTIMYEYVRR
jgi:16S rRNA G966 N2-methylase RsmD